MQGVKLGERHLEHERRFSLAHLKDLPAFRALLRAVEARFYQDLCPWMNRCWMWAVATGILPRLPFPTRWRRASTPQRVLGEARERGAYHVLAQSLGDALPFADGHFATVVSNSVLEHIPRGSGAGRDQPRAAAGWAVHLLCAQRSFRRVAPFHPVFRRLRLEALARPMNAISTASRGTITVMGRSMAGPAGRSRPAAQRFLLLLFRAGHPCPGRGPLSGAPSLVAKKLFGRWVLAPSRWNLALTERWLRPLYEEPLPESGPTSSLLQQSPETVQIRSARAFCLSRPSNSAIICKLQCMASQSDLLSTILLP